MAYDMGLLEDYIKSMGIPFEEIELATNNLADENLITRGRYAYVYKGQLSQSGELINIVVRKDREPIRENLLVKELMMYKDLKHKNIMSLFKFTFTDEDDEDQKFVAIHTHEANGSLDKHVTGSTLTWMQRLQICLGLAHALCYLHSGLQDDYSVIHGNIKSSKVLLDHNWEPKLHDFKCAVKVRRHNLYLTSKYNGALQYMDPAFESTGGLTHKSDVFSFGVILFEVLFGMKASIQEEDNWHFAQMARLHYDEKKLDDMIDPDLRKQMDTKSLELFSETAYFCLKEQRINRPDMEQIVKRLEKALEVHQNLVHSTATLNGASSNRLKGAFMDHLKVPLREIKLATDNFSERYLIGSGGYGKVYKAELKCFDGTRTVAIKHIHRKEDEHAQQGFIAEIEILSKCKHTNIVSLLGFCDEDDDMILIYEYASNGSLEGYLSKVDKMTNFTWAQRIKICLDVANGLHYLHTGIHGENTIIHRDIKSENILLDDKWVAKIADFGLSKLHQGNQQLNTLVTNNIAGTPFYLDPVYEKEGKLKGKSDIYSFGVVLFEILTGKLAYDKTFHGMGLAPIARQSYKDRTLKKLVDPKIKEAGENISLNFGVNQISLDKFSEIAYKCVAESQNDRPTIGDVIRELEEALHYQENNNDNLQISLEELNSGTENFSDRKCIAEGRYWKQYVGEITHLNKRTTVIAKRWDSKFPLSRQQFFTELRIHYEYKHENIVTLVGYCNEMGEKIIVYENASNGSLDKHLSEDSLTWFKRLKICIDVARGLEFLHTSVSMIHRDIKSASILLDGDWKAKISNLELSTHLSDMKPIEHATGDDAYGSEAYLSPVDKKSGYLTRESDIYSLGVVLKEMLSRSLMLPNHNHPHPFGRISYWDTKYILGRIKQCAHPKSITPFTSIVKLCLSSDQSKRPKAKDVIIELEKALKFYEDYEIWEARLPTDYENIIQMSKSPIDSSIMKKDLYDIFSKGILLKDGKVWFSLGSNGERNEMISARKFSYKNRRSHKWRSVQESRFQKVAKMWDNSKLKIQINITTQFLSPNVNYGAHLIFKFCDKRKLSCKSMYVNLKYKMGGDNMHAYFAKWRDDEWMMIELGQFLCNKEDTYFEVLLESFSRYYCGSGAIHIEGIEFRATKKTEHTQQDLKSKPNEDQFSPPFDEQLLPSIEMNGKKHLTLSAKDVLYESSNVKCFHSKPSAESRFEEVIELLPQQVFRISCKIQSQLLSPDTDYLCFLVFKLSEKCRGLHCPVKVRNILHRSKKEPKVLYFRLPSAWNLQDNIQVPGKREDGWMEVIVGNFNSTSELRNDYIPINLKLITYEGTMSGLIVCGLEIRPM